MDPASYAALSAADDDACAQTAAGLDRITRTVYDEASQRRQLRVGVGTGVEAAEATWAYNANGQVTIVIDGNGNRAQLRYDGHMRQDRWTFPSTTRPAAYDDTNPTTALASAGAVNPNDYEEYGYDEAGNRTRLRRRDNWPLAYGDILYQYDSLNRLIRKTVPERPAPHPQPLAADQTRDVFYGYDLRNLQTFARFDSASGEGVTNVYDAFGRLGSTTVNLGGVSRELRFQYREDGARTRIRHPDGAGFGWNYDARGQLADVRVEPEVLNWPLATVSRDPFGRPSVLTRGAEVSATVFYYYPTDWPWIIGHNLAGGAADDLTLSFSYNRAGQISQASRDNVTDAYTYRGHANIQLDGSIDGLNRIANTGFAHDANGNLIADPGGWSPGHVAHSYTYDVENRLVGASGGVTLRYDPLGRLWQLAAPSGTTSFLYDGDALTLEYDSSGTVLRRYIHGSNGGADDPLVQYEGATLNVARYFFADERGSIVAVADANGNAIARNSYDEYGVPAAGNLGRFQYTGQLWLPELGLYHYKARMYAPALGRMMQTDPVGYDGGINLYAYVRNDPINRMDPTGTRSLNAYEASLVNQVFESTVQTYQIDVFRCTGCGSRSMVAPWSNIHFARRDWSEDYSQEGDPRKLHTFWHEIYHVFEMQIGLVSWSQLARNQMSNRFGEDIYAYDARKSFMEQNPEARAQYFAGCMTGGPCAALEGFRAQYGQGRTIQFNDGRFRIRYEETGSRIPHTRTIRPSRQGG